MNKFIWIFITPIFITVLSGCGVISSAAVVTLPAAKIRLNPEPSKYYQYTAEISSYGNIFKIDHIWHCEHEMYFSANNMDWNLRWVPSQASFVKMLDNRQAVYIELPNVCDISSNHQYSPRIVHITEANEPSLIKSYPGTFRDEMRGDIFFKSSSIDHAQ